MTTKNYARHDVGLTVNESAIDPIFQLQQTAFEVPSASAAPLSTSSVPVSSLATGLHDEDNLHDLHHGADQSLDLSLSHNDHESLASEALRDGIAESIALSSSRQAIPPDLDTSTADLTYRRNRRDFSANNPSPEGWLYPHKKGIGTGSNLEAFKADIEARTQRGENCKTIADALNALGVQTSDRAVSRVRIKWGMRKRAQRKQKTPPPESEAARISAKSKVQALRKIEITRMTREGLTAEEIFENLTSRGMELKKGVATVLRLQSAWKLTHNEKRWVENFRHQRHKQARAQQLQAFRDIAKELKVEDVDAWLTAKMKEDSARQARHELALKMMGEHAPKNPERRKLQKSKKKADVSTDGQQPRQDDDSGSDSDAGLGYESEYPVGGAEGGYPSLHDHTDIDMENEDGLEAETSPAHVDSGVLAHVDVGLEKTASSPKFAPVYPTSALPITAAMLDPRLSQSTTSVPQPPSVAPSHRSPSKHRTGRSNRNSITKPVSTADMGAAQSSSVVQSTSCPFLGTSAGPGELQNLDNPSEAMEKTTATSTAAPMLVLCPEEAEANKTALSTLDQYNAAAQAYKEMLQARNDNKPLPGSLTGLPPSSKEVEAAKHALREITQAMMLSLE